MKNQNSKPPKLADRLFDSFIGNANIEDLRGDVVEMFYKNVKSRGTFRAKFIYWLQIISLLLSYAILKRKKDAAYSIYVSNNSLAMFQNYFKVAVRNLSKNKLFAFINIIGMGVGMSIGLLAFAMWNNINNFDKFHTNKDKIYRVITKVTKESGEVMDFAPTMAPLADEFAELSGVKQTVRINYGLNDMVNLNDNEIRLEGYLAEPSYFDIFSFPLEKGNPKTALENPFSIVLTTETAIKLFKEEDPMNKVVEVIGQGDFMVTGVFKDYPRGTHLKCDMVASYSTLSALEKSGQVQKSIGNWNNYRWTYLYALLDERIGLDKIQQGLNSIAESKNPIFEKFKASFSLQPFVNISLGKDLFWNNAPFDLIGIIFFFILAFLILIPACFNYANISIARAMKRAKEIGLRKVVGGQRSQIFTQFIVETFVIVFIALFIAIYLYTLIAAEFSSMIYGADTIDFSLSISTLSYFVFFACICGFIAGIVPALYFSKIKPIDALKSSFKVGSFTSTGIRKFLISAQFALSLFLIIGVAVVIRQYVFSMNFSLGYNKENILVVELKDADYQLFENEFSAMSEVQSISFSSDILHAGQSNSTFVHGNNALDSVRVYQLFVDESYIAIHEIELLKGDNFKEMSSKESMEQVVVNQAFIKQFALMDSAASNNNTYSIGDKQLTVVGVVKDFNYQLLDNKIKPFFFRYNQDKFKYANVKIQNTDVLATLLKFEYAWQKLGSEQSFEAKFLDDEIAESYEHLFFLMKIFGFLSLLAITITCLGLLGMVVFSNENRVKEIGIRKVMGASTQNLMYILSYEFFKLMAIAIMIATPLAYFFYDFMMSQTQAYYYGVGLWEISLSILMLCMLGITTIVWQTYKAASANPVNNLRYE